MQLLLSLSLLNHLHLLGKYHNYKIFAFINIHFSHLRSSLASITPAAESSNLNQNVANIVDLRSQTSPPVVGIIETENTKTPSDDGEVFYIFYENEDIPQVNRLDKFCQVTH